ncbi:MAG: putative glycoside hydrolase [Treponemataceae bacterium]
MKKLFAIVFTLTCFLTSPAQEFLVGTDTGLYNVEGVPYQIFSNIAIYSIQKNAGVYFFLTNRGIMKSEDLRDYSFLTEGLPKKTLKLESNGKFRLTEKVQKLKDLAFHPDDPNIFVTATNAAVFLTTNGGKSWQSLGTYGNTNGIKAVAVTNLPDKNGISQLTVFVSTSMNGLAWKQPFVSRYWYDANVGLAKGPEGPDEVSDILIYKDGTNRQEIFLAQTFKGRLFKYNWQFKIAVLVDNKDKKISSAKYLDSLNYTSTVLTGVKENEVFVTPVLFPQVYSNKFYEALSKQITKSLTSVKLKSVGIFGTLNCAFIDKDVFKLQNDLTLNELFALRLKEKISCYTETANEKRAIYLPPHKISEIDSYLALMKKNNLNALVIDMKDDWGFIRYNSTEPNVKKVGAVRPTIILEELVKIAKENDIYLIARLVVFKDKEFYYYANGNYAVKDYTTGRSWRGYDVKPDGTRNYYYEYWVDPYNEKVWKYNTAVANELITRGFDEIQFDYIRFPTDGDNLRNAYYPAKSENMDKESAIMSFLAYARNHIKAPISIDIYGVNGWYRTGAKTGQEVEMLTDYVDVICPMYYPSHFAQSFLAYEPRKERPYRIYYQGAYRSKFISRNKNIIRPWAQCFFINVSYDRQFYGAYYVKSQITALSDSINEGFSFWNTIGNYKDLPVLDE